MKRKTDLHSVTKVSHFGSIGGMGKGRGVGEWLGREGMGREEREWEGMGGEGKEWEGEGEKGRGRVRPQGSLLSQDHFVTHYP